MSELMEIATLGTLTIQRAGKPITDLSTHKVEALLVYLACTGQVQARETLAELLWSEHDQAHAAANLRMALTTLRKQLEAYILTTYDTVALNWEAASWLDVREFEAYLAVVETHWTQTGTLSPIDAAQLEKAVALYRDEFLKNFYLRDSPNFEQWMLIERERLRRQVAEALHRLAGWYIGCHAYRSGIQRTARLLQIDPLAEDAHRQMMRLLALTGQRHEALAQYQTCRELLADELGVAPAPETTALYEQIQQGQLAPDVSVSETSLPGTGLEILQNPYKGLRPFQEADAPDFFGRATLTEALLTRLEAKGNGAAFLAVVGPSGSGKSSVVRAGLIPMLRQGKLPGSEQWLIAEMFPTAHPLKELVLALLRVTNKRPVGLIAQLQRDARGLLRVLHQLLPDKTSQLLLIVDQFEELFTLVTDAAERAHFLDSLLAAANDPHSQLKIVITLRADFYDRPLQYPQFGELIEQHTQLVLPLTPYELERAIVGPAERVGMSLESGLVSAIIADVYEQPGALPLLQFALTEMFDKRKGRLLTLEAYQAVGGTMGALARRADSLHQELDSQGQEIARQVFLRLVSLGEGTEDTRRRTLQTELLLADTDADRVKEIIDLFCRFRLLTLDRDPITGNPTVEVAHEALLRMWGRLRHWIDTSRADLHFHQRLSAAATEWLTANCEKSFLLSGVHLEQFETWLGGTSLALNQQEQDYIQASIAAREAEQAQERTRRAAEAANARLARNFMRITTILAVVGTLAIIAIIMLGLESANARAQVMSAGQTLTPIPVTLTAVAQRIGDSTTTMELLRLSAEADKLLLARNGNVETAALLGIRALRTAYLAEADSTLMQAIETMYTRQVFIGHSEAVYAVAFSPVGQYVASGGGDSVVKLWDSKTAQLIRTFAGHTDRVYSLAFSPDGKYLVSGSKDHTARLWDIQTGRMMRVFGTRRNPVYRPGHFGPINSLAFSPDGSYVLTGGDFSVWLWDVQSGQSIYTFLPAHDCAVFSVAYAPDGKTIAIGCNNQTIELWDVQTRQPIHYLKGHTGAVWATQFSPDGKYLVSGSRDGTARLWDIQTERTLRTFVGHASDVQTLAFSPDGNYLLTASADQTARLWDVKTGQLLRLFSGHIGPIWSAAFSPDGKSILTGADDTMMRLWDARTDLNIRTFGAHEAAIWSVAFSPDGSLILSAGDDHKANVWQVKSRQPLVSITGQDSIYTAVFSPDGKTFLTGSTDHTPRLWDASTGQLIRSFSGTSISSSIYAGAFSPDGKLVITCGDDRTARLWEVETGRLIQTLTGHNETVASVAFAPDSKYVLTGSYDKTARLWDIATGQSIRTFTGHTNYVNSVTFSPDGKYVLTGSADTTARLWNTEMGEAVLTLSGHSGAVSSAIFSPDGKYVLTGSADTTARLWDARTGQVIRVFSGHVNAVTKAAFAPDGKTIVTSSLDKTVRVWPVAYQDFIGYVCSQLVRDFTDDERLQYGLKDNNPTCPQFGRSPVR